MSTSTKPTLSKSLLISKSIQFTTQNAKAMFDRIWSVAELLAEADQQESETDQHSQVAEKTQP